MRSGIIFELSMNMRSVSACHERQNVAPKSTSRDRLRYHGCRSMSTDCYLSRARQGLNAETVDTANRTACISPVRDREALAGRL
jgi:hypothetical protein